MAGTVSTTIHGRFWRGVVALVLLSAAAQAETLPDPTRPPAELGATAITPGAALAEEVLQSVILSPGRHAAIISGQLVRVGESYGDAKLVEVGEGQAILKGAEGRRVLRLFPEVALVRKSEAQGTAGVAGTVGMQKKAGANQKGAQ
jgi:MSHA biogenesis protein MshK